jgi:pilus assembly protein Flp/PilA
MDSRWARSWRTLRLYAFGVNALEMLRRLVSDCRGAAAAEYAMLLAIVGSVLVIAAIGLGDSISCSIERTALTISQTTVTKNHQYGKSNPKGNAFGQKKTC